VHESRTSLSTWLATHADVICISLVLLMMYVAPFHRALSFPPSESNDLRFLSQVSKVSNPLKYLAGDWGEAPYMSGEYGMYRPIHPISLWLVYKGFGVWALPNQFINLALHFSNVLLLLITLLRIHKDRVFAALFSALFMASVYTVSPAIWVTDRADLQVGLALLLLIYHIVTSGERQSPLNAWYVLLLSGFALLSKESGIVVPLLAALVSAHRSPTNAQRIRRGAPYVLIVGAYMFMRFLMFGSHAAAYHNGGYLFGVQYYSTFNDLPEHLRTASLVDNFVKNILAMFVPLFSEMGQWDFGKKALLGTAGTMALVVLSSKKLTTLQWYCLWIIVLNAAIHFQIFRFRTLYVAQIAFCVFLGASRVGGPEARRQMTIAMASVVLFLSLISVDNYVLANYVSRNAELYDRKLETTMKMYPGRIDPDIAQRVLNYYK
jgi:hypothetical protein